ncbi:hypothetical protein [Piscinibacterium candidicorallinum]|uniref:Meckel syndrome type 1 protein n=1 Tax=Piscinibacterium candidicorallinum TaxID=1793872 RepID=A0ABV7H5U5_9BURK
MSTPNDNSIPVLTEIIELTDEAQRQRAGPIADISLELPDFADTVSPEQPSGPLAAEVEALAARKLAEALDFKLPDAADVAKPADQVPEAPPQVDQRLEPTLPPAQAEVPAPATAQPEASAALPQAQPTPDTVETMAAVAASEPPDALPLQPAGSPAPGLEAAPVPTDEPPSLIADPMALLAGLNAGSQPSASASPLEHAPAFLFSPARPTQIEPTAVPMPPLPALAPSAVPEPLPEPLPAVVAASGPAAPEVAAAPEPATELTSPPSEPAAAPASRAFGMPEALELPAFLLAAAPAMRSSADLATPTIISAPAAAVSLPPPPAPTPFQQPSAASVAALPPAAEPAMLPAETPQPAAVPAPIAPITVAVAAPVVPALDEAAIDALEARLRDSILSALAPRVEQLLHGALRERVAEIVDHVVASTRGEFKVVVHESLREAIRRAVDEEVARALKQPDLF